MFVYTISDFIRELELKGLLTGTDIVSPYAEQEVTELTFDSRKVTPGTLFIAKGIHFKDEYLFSALENGAVAYLSDRVIADRPNYITVNDIRTAMAVVSKMFYRDPQRKLTTFAVTGTKGKTTTSYYLKEILDTYAAETKTRECGFMSTIDTYDGIERFESTNTTPESPDVWRHFANAVKSGIENYVVEVSAQALKYKRVEGVTFNVAGFTNIDNDHISEVEHPTFEDYFYSKLKLFDNCRIACVNTDDPKSDVMLDYIGGRVPVITWGSHETDTIYCKSIETKPDGIYFEVVTPLWSRTMKITMPGEFNVKNALCAIAMTYAVGIPPETMAKALEVARTAGRMQVFKSEDENVIVIVDYAHNKNSFETLCEYVCRIYPDRKKIACFGLHGAKSRNRREEVGKIVGGCCDYAVITEKDPATEPFAKIAHEIAVHLEECGCPYDIEEFRQDAIRRSVFKDIGPRVIMFAGRGAETHMIRGTSIVTYPSDIESTIKVLGEYDAIVAAKKASV
ncbi:MAG: Mur ligase family protein [Eubacteriales bacterium]